MRNVITSELNPREKMSVLLRNKSNFGLELVKRTLMHRSVATISTSVKQCGKPGKSFTQSDFDRVRREEVAKFQKDIKKISSEDPFSPVIGLLKALTIGFVLATICSISYGESPLNCLN